MKYWLVSIHDMSTGYTEKCLTYDEMKAVYDDFIRSAKYTCDVVEAEEVTIHYDGHRTSRPVCF